MSVLADREQETPELKVALDFDEFYRREYRPILAPALALTELDLREIQDEVTQAILNGEVPGIVGFGYSSTDIMRGLVEIGAMLITGDAQDWLEARYGSGVVRNVSSLVPVS